MTEVTKWLHKETNGDDRFAADLLHSVWRRQASDEDPISRYALAAVLIELGAELRKRAGDDQQIEWLGQRYIDMGGYLGSQLECPWVLEPLARPRPSRWKRLRKAWTG